MDYSIIGDIVNGIIALFVVGVLYLNWLFHLGQKDALEEEGREAEKAVDAILQRAEEEGWGLSESPPSSDPHRRFRAPPAAPNGSNGGPRPKRDRVVRETARNAWMPEGVEEIAKREFEKIMKKATAEHGGVVGR